ncbi:MAG: hypothetical protein P4L16_01190 [Chlamydiales bacterium]|nr:hypothetical protein [Chlamydiales bacterium]
MSLPSDSDLSNSYQVQKHLDSMNKSLEGAKGYQEIGGSVVWTKPGVSQKVLWNLFSWIPGARRLFGVIRIPEVQARLVRYQAKVEAFGDKRLIDTFNATVRCLNTKAHLAGPIIKELKANPTLEREFEEAWFSQNLDSTKPIRFFPDWKMTPQGFQKMLTTLLERSSETRKIDLSDCPWVTKEHLATLKDVSNIVSVAITERSDLTLGDIPAEVYLRKKGEIKFDPQTRLTIDVFRDILTKAREKGHTTKIDLSGCDWVRAQHLKCISGLERDSKGVVTRDIVIVPSVREETSFSEPWDVAAVNHWIKAQKDMSVSLDKGVILLAFSAKPAISAYQFAAILDELRREGTNIQGVDFSNCSWVTDAHMDALKSRTGKGSIQVVSGPLSLPKIKSDRPPEEFFGKTLESVVSSVVTEEVFQTWLSGWIKTSKQSGAAVVFDANVPLSPTQFRRALIELTGTRDDRDITEFNFSNCVWMTKEHLSVLVTQFSLLQLKHINLQGCVNLTDADIATHFGRKSS